MAAVLTRTGVTPFLLVTNILTWISSIIIMGILSHWIAQQPDQPNRLVYEEVVAVLTAVFFLAAFFLGRFTGALMAFYIVFAFLWLVALAFAAEDFTHATSQLGHVVEAFTFIAFFAIFFNICHEWFFTYRGAERPAMTTGPTMTTV